MKKVLVAVLAFITFACAPHFVTSSYSEYAYNGGVVTIGMTASEVRSAIGPPRLISKLSGLRPTLQDHLTQFWHYGYKDRGDRKHVNVILEGGIVVAIKEYDYSDSNQ